MKKREEEERRRGRGREKRKTSGFRSRCTPASPETVSDFPPQRRCVFGDPGSEIQVHLDDLQRHLHYAEYPGALLCGVKGAVVKCHGYSTPEAFANGIRGAIEFASTHFITILKNQL